MAAISALADYGADSSDSDGDTTANIEEFHLHLKPINQTNAIATISKPSDLSAAPVVAVKVRIFCD